MDLYLLLKTALGLFLLGVSAWAGLQGSTWLHRVTLVFVVLGLAGTLLHVPVALEARAFFDGRVPNFVGMPALKQYMLAQFVPTTLAGVLAFGIHCWPGWGKRKVSTEAGTAA